MNDIVLLLLLGLTTYRATWFVTRDSFPPMRRIREWLLSRANDSGTYVQVDELGHEDDHGEYRELRGGWSWAAELITCYWCVSAWLAAAFVFLTNLVHDLSLPFLWFGATAAIAATISFTVDKFSGGE